MLNKAMFSVILMVSSIWFNNAHAECAEESCSGQIIGPVAFTGAIEIYGDAFIFAIVDATSEVSAASDDICHYEEGTWLVARPMNVAQNSAATITAKAMQDVLSAGQSGANGQQVMGFYYDWNAELDVCVITAVTTVN